jgi:hypothetical protein
VRLSPHPAFQWGAFSKFQALWLATLTALSYTPPVALLRVLGITQAFEYCGNSVTMRVILF